MRCLVPVVLLLVACGDPRAGQGGQDGGPAIVTDGGPVDGVGVDGGVIRPEDVYGYYRMPQQLSLTLQCDGGTVQYQPGISVGVEAIDPNWTAVFPDLSPQEGGIALILGSLNGAKVASDGRMTVVEAIDAVAPEVFDESGQGEPNGAAGFLLYSAVFSINPSRLSGTMTIRDQNGCRGATQFAYERQASQP